jgi:transcriptional regulator of acetoin/glycerol metabolism
MPSLAPATVRSLLAYDWPANVRELQQALARAAVLSKGERIERAHLPAEVSHVGAAGLGARGPSSAALRDERLRRELVAALDRHRGNVSDVAREMGKARMQVHRWMRKLRLDPSVFRR